MLIYLFQYISGLLMRNCVKLSKLFPVDYNKMKALEHHNSFKKNKKAGIFSL